jgi:hypothetical protein
VLRTRRSRDHLPVPRGAAWYADGAWYKVERGHFVIGRWHRRLWRSHGRFARAYEFGALALSRRALAFSYGLRPWLYLARFGSPERPIAANEVPIGWTRRGDLLTHGTRSGGLRVRDSTGRLIRTLARKVFNHTFDRTSGELYFVANGRVERSDGRRTVNVASLAHYGLSRAPELEPLGRLLALRSRRRVVVLRRNGSLFAATRLPRPRSRVDGISSALAAAPSGRAVALAFTRGNTAYGSRGSEAVYVLRRGERRARPIHRERMRFAVCERGADIAWHGRWILYSTSEGNLVAIDTHGRRSTVGLTRTVLRLPGTRGAEGHADLSASWSGGHSG